MTETRPAKRRWRKILLPLLIIAIGIIAFKLLGQLKQAPQRQEAAVRGALVETISLEHLDYQLLIHTTGTVEPQQQIVLTPQVSGRVVWLSPKLVTGGFFKRGDLLLRIERDDFELALEQAGAEIAQAKLALATERERARVALREWQRMPMDNKGQPGPLVTRKIQLQQEQARLAAAQANLKLAQLNLQRTELRAPFNGRVRSEQVDRGQYIRSGSSIATLAGTDRAEIHAPVAATQLTWLRQTPQHHPEALISVAQQPRTWRGRLDRDVGEIDSKSRLATLIIAIDDPYQLKSTTSAPLPNGQFVNIELKGPILQQVYRIPRKALRNDATVWLADADDRLDIKAVEVLYRDKDSLIIAPDLPAGSRLIVSSLSAAAHGTLLRPVAHGATP